MKQIVRWMAALTLLIFLMAMPTYAAQQSGNQKECPVLGSPINKNLYVDYKGKRVYFCCPPCVSKFNKDPEKYMKKLEEQGVVPEDTPSSKK